MEDDELLRWSLSKLFSSLGYKVFGVGSAEEALTRLHEERVDLVVTDFQLPGLDGIELTRRLRALPALREVPVVMISAHRNEQIDAEAQQAGIAEIHSKPVAIEYLRQTLEKLLKS